MSRQPQGTVGVFTTQKLQALLDSRCHSEAVSRAGLARAMSRAGSPISVHGIDGWFRPQDSNYGIERPSLERGRRTYPLPKRRWRVLIDLFSLTLEDLDCTDADFRRWCFARMRRASTVADGAPAPWPTPEPVTDRPSIAVLPLTNLPGDEETAMLAQSLTEDITTLLSRIPEFFVIAHSTMRTYRHGPPDRDTLRRQLGVRYLLEGSLRTDGETLRVTTELIDAGSGASLFGQRFDRPMTDLFRVQDEITTAICAQLEPRVRVEDIAYGARQGSVSSWRLWQEGWYWLFIDAPQPSPDRSLQRFRQAVELEPDYALGHAGLAIALSTALLWGGLGRDAQEEAREHAGIASRLLPENPVVLYAMAMISFVGPGSLEIPLEYIERAVELEPSNAIYQGVRGYLLANLGRAREGVECCLHAMRLSPKDAREPFLCYMLGAAYVANEQYELAIETMTRCRRFSEVDFIWLMIAFSHAQLGERDRALASLKRITAPRPCGFYRWAIRESLWLGLPEREKEDFLSLLPRAGIE